MKFNYPFIGLCYGLFRNTFYIKDATIKDLDSPVVEKRIPLLYSQKLFAIGCSTIIQIYYWPIIMGIDMSRFEIWLRNKNTNSYFVKSKKDYFYDYIINI